MDNLLILKHDDVFLIGDVTGDIPPNGIYGLYWQDTRFLSRLQLVMNDGAARHLSTVQPFGFLAHVYLANGEVPVTEGALRRGPTVALRRSCCVAGGLLQEIEITNFSGFAMTVELSLAFAADFLDMFEVRGAERARRGEYLPAEIVKDGLVFRYRGRDALLRETRVSFSIAPDRLADHTATFRLTLGPGESRTVELRIVPYINGQTCNAPAGHGWNNLAEAQAALCRAYARWLEESTFISTEHPLLNRLLQQSQGDLYLLLERLSTGPYPVAGIPWFAVPFGRDGIITALESLIINPDIARGVLYYLACHQGQVVNEQREEEPGKILHEMRYGEMARTGEIPHTPYFGSIDATPLFLVLFAQAMDWLDDDDLYADLLPAVHRALEWIDRYGDLDGDGYVEYLPRATHGLRNQGWKDSPDSLQYPDGTWVTLPAALVEVQGYVFDAKARLAQLFRRKGETRLAERLEEEAASLQARFNRDFWIAGPINRDGIPADAPGSVHDTAGSGFLAQALDGEKRPVPSVTSNMGHALWSGIVADDRASLVAGRLMAEDMFSGWGIRTLASTSPNYNPMSYHNGSVWPHDNALIAAGLRRYGFVDQAVRVAQAILEVGMNAPDLRLPELFCGFARDQARQPVAYPVACRPQAWAAASVFLLLQTLLGLEVAGGHLSLQPCLPRWMGRVQLRNLRVGQRRVSVTARGDKVLLLRETGNPRRTRRRSKVA